MKKLLSGILSLVMVFSLTPSTIVFAENDTGGITQTQAESTNTSDDETNDVSSVSTASESGTDSSSANEGGATTENSYDTVTLDLTNGKILISPTGYSQNGSDVVSFTGTYTITGSLTCDTPLSFVNESGSAVEYNVIFDNAHLLGKSWCSAVTFKNTSNADITLNITNKGQSEVRAYGGPSFQTFNSSANVSVNITETDGSSLKLDPQVSQNGYEDTQIYSSNINFKINDQTVDNSSGYKTGEVNYLDSNGTSQYVVADNITSDITSLGEDNKTTWYVVKENITNNNRIGIHGNVNIIFGNGATLTANAGIEVPDDCTLTFYGGKKQNGTLVIPCQQAAWRPGINVNSEGKVVINGGIVEANGDWNQRAAIGKNEDKGIGGTVEVNNGTLKAIGGNSSALSTNLIVNGGTIEASTGDKCDTITGTVIVNGGSLSVANTNASGKAISFVPDIKSGYKMKTGVDANNSTDCNYSERQTKINEGVKYLIVIQCENPHNYTVSVVDEKLQKICSLCNDTQTIVELQADDMVYSGNAYTGATLTSGSEDNGFYQVSGSSRLPYNISDITYKYEQKKGEEYTDIKANSLIDAGQYRVKASFTYNDNQYTLSKEFKITKANQSAPSEDSIEVTNETVKGKSDGSIKNKTTIAMEYTSDGMTYTAINESVGNLSSGTYDVRYVESFNYNASDPFEVIIQSGNQLSVTVPTEQVGYTLIPSTSSVDYNGSSTLTFTLANGYSKMENFAVKVNGNAIQLNENEQYTIVNIQSNQTITVEGVADITEPVINGIENKKTYTKTTTFTVSDANLKEVKIDGTVVTPDNDGKYTLVPKNGTYTVEAIDSANNSTIITVTVNKEKVSVPTVANKTYTGKTLAADINSNDLYTVDKNDGGINVGKYSVELKLNDPVNYKWSDSDEGAVSIYFEITKATPIVTVTPATSLTYNGEEQALITESSPTFVEIKYQVNDGEWSTNIPKANNTGTYRIKYKVEGTENYDGVEEQTVEVTITPKDISQANVTLGATLSYTSKEQTQGIKSVVVDGLTVDTYKVTGDKATDVGTHTLKITGTGNFTGTVTKDYVVLPNQSSQMKEMSDGKVQYGKGTITFSTNRSENLVTSKTELVELLISNGGITTEELEDIYNGASMNVSLTITDVTSTLSSDIKTSLQDTAKKNGLTIGNQYLDISLYKNASVISTTSSKVKISLAVADEMINTDKTVNRTYYVIRYHDGEVSIIDGVFNEKAKTFTFETDQFSAYVLAYKDTKIEDKNTTKPTDTSDPTNIALYGGLVLLSLIGIVILSKRRKA